MEDFTSEVFWAWTFLFWKFFDYWFNLLTSFGYSDFLFLHNSVLVGFMIRRTCPFHLECSVCWYAIFILFSYNNFYFCKICFSIPSFIYNSNWVYSSAVFLQFSGPTTASRDLQHNTQTKPAFPSVLQVIWERNQDSGHLPHNPEHCKQALLFPCCPKGATRNWSPSSQHSTLPWAGDGARVSRSAIKFPAIFSVPFSWLGICLLQLFNWFLEFLQSCFGL